LSPSARKSQAEHAIHNDYHDFPALQKETSSHSQVSETEQEETRPAEIMTDDEGTPADVAASIALFEVRAYTLFSCLVVVLYVDRVFWGQESDVPKDSPSVSTINFGSQPNLCVPRISVARDCSRDHCCC